jgi:hypothetical protein
MAVNTRARGGGHRGRGRGPRGQAGGRNLQRGGGRGGRGQGGRGQAAAQAALAAAVAAAAAAAAQQAAANTPATDEVAFTALLLRLGLTDEQAESIQDSQHIPHLMRLSQLDITVLKQVFYAISRNPDGQYHIPVINQESIKDLCFWANRKKRMEMDLDPIDYNDAEKLEMQSLRDDFYPNTDEEAVNEAPKIFKEYGANIGTSIEQLDIFSEYIKKQKCQQGHHSLAYLIRDLDDTADPDDDFDTYEEQDIACTPHNGIFYNSDNKVLWKLIQSWMRHSNAYVHIKSWERTSDGRSAWKKIKSFFCGENTTRRQVWSAKCKLQSIQFSKQTKQYKLEDYITQTAKFHQILADYGEPLNERIQVMQILNGITDPSLQPAKQILAANTDKMNSVAKTTEFLVSIATINTFTNQSNRNISSMNQRGGRGRDQRRGGGGRGHGRGRGRGGRGRGRQGGGGGDNNKFTGTINGTMTYTPKEWKSMTHDQHLECYEARDVAQKRKISFLEQAAKDTEDEDDKEDNDSSGQYGRAAHQHKKKKNK